MSDPRAIPANERVAAASLRGRVKAPRFAEGSARRVAIPVADLSLKPGGKRTRQWLMGAPVTCYELHEGHTFVQGEDGYVGYLPEAALHDGPAPTHWISARASHSYNAPDLKSPERMALSHLSRVAVTKTQDNWAETALGHIPLQHLSPLPMAATDPVAVAEIYLGAPYFWGGNSAFGIDCSGLVQAGCRACGIACPGDSDQQEEVLGSDLAEDALLRRGDLLFWKGHVAWVLDEARILHANAHSMSVSTEPLEAAVTRIAEQGGGPVTARKRL
ncbi:Cell wall-associated hydrolase, NlpC family [Roseovarius nanhaiticus]|uniref:Cell wall-associated hydrolase, NlpC family n=1 Tax=Roseovarius nanhaiticus TaxID=573024 RepID=A0A1N7FI66_9RHOB|nr:NlpC/P60 family protein [Roseovarius nanhaiticus]SEK54058.1 Cell wall-associated hydrolase, NlpC family [Roseovarius nanhaiticus]SIR99980.1 Cell wall-associated hydrolase, NlpC family [Roseovarius nanhaiticus]